MSDESSTALLAYFIAHMKLLHVALSKEQSISIVAFIADGYANNIIYYTT